ncbi:uncharacterized protein N7459_003170 [Penicillium hispanicum]|uniref:uncharacterized protein n=1 Tax=Penicillium hispanicum TaxID=1080232 RepID=UPI0025415CC8|nr:uncharacterized protein N7459_003170 [Penicillium hispanicum]KAJ5587405.1 hypothetical protein N7459_003170 [Penicillium hispanicum]
MDPPRNRKQRRAAAATSPMTSDSDIPLAHPPRDNPSKKTDQQKTLYDIIAERQNELLAQQAASSATSGSAVGLGLPSQPKGTRFVTVDASGALVDTDADINSQIPVNRGKHKSRTGESDKEDESEIEKSLPPLIDTVLLAFPLTTLHLTLAYLAAHQYAESTDVPRLLKDAVTTVFPLLTFLIHFAHGHIVAFKLRGSLRFLAAANAQPVSLLPLTQDKLTLSFLGRLLFPPALRTIIFLPIAAVLGVHLITITNGEPYYAVMKKAPAYGTMWIWCILEMSFGPAVLGALGPLVWGVWWMGYGIV